MSRRAVVFGASGQLAVELVRELAARGYAVTGLTRADVDICDGAAVESALARLDPQVVFNAAAYNQVDVAEQEPQAAYMVNGLGGPQPGAGLPAGGRPAGPLLDRLRVRRRGPPPVRGGRPDPPPRGVCRVQTRRRIVRARLSGSIARWWSGRPASSGPAA